MVIHLRPYQRLALYHLRRCLEVGAWRQYLDLPTGTGKSTHAAAFAAQRLGQTQGRVLALVHRQDLALQLAETLRQEELEVGLLMEGSHTLHTSAVVATVQSLTPDRHSLLLFKKGETYKKLEPMPVEDAGEREEKQRDEPSQLSSPWGDAGISERTSA